MNNRPKNPYSPFRMRKRPAEWLLIIFMVLLGHLLIFVFLKPSYLEIFRSDPPGEDGSSRFKFINQSMTMDPYPDYVEQISEMDDPVEVVDEEEVIKAFLNEFGEPALDVEPIQKGRRSGGSDGLKGPRRSTVEPKPLFMPWPKFPNGVDRDIKGKVELLLFVDEEGLVREIKISNGLSHDLLNATAIEAARDIRFVPGEIKGVPTAMWIRLTIGFQPR
ncbi:MAG: energy transducer TonB [Candidatus Krumholzibacteria bacterium]|nr:energy transducer TonB [Candidatus Krumholzibacteria bacterium]